MQAAVAVTVKSGLRYKSVECKSLESAAMESRIELEFPHKIHEIDLVLQEKLKREFHAGRSGFVQVGKDKWFLPRKYVDEAEKLYNFKVREDDVWLVTFPRSGTTWTQEMIWLLENNLDYATALKKALPERFPFFEYHIINHEKVVKEFLKENTNSIDNQILVEQICGDHLEDLRKCNTRRFIKTHLPFSLLPPDLLKSGCKVIYVARNPKDVAVSYYHLSRLARNIDYSGDFPTFWRYFTENLTLWSPYWEHVKEAWLERSNKNLCFLFYENLFEDLRGTILHVAKFFGKSLSKTDVDGLEDHLKFENFKHNKSVNSQREIELGIFRRNEENYVRKGMKGGWKEYFTENMALEAKNWIEMNEKRIGIQFHV